MIPMTHMIESEPAMNTAPVDFVHVETPQTVYFGIGRAAQHLAAALDALGGERVLLIASPREMERASRLLPPSRVAGTFTDVVVHVPKPQAEAAKAVALESRADAIVAVGGGSATGLAKIVAQSFELPIVAVPTTYSGSEATETWGITDGQVKRNGVDPLVLPKAVVYDASLSATLPLSLSVPSGINGIAHCVDAMWGPKADPILRATAEEGIRQLAAALRALVADPGDMAARGQALIGVYLAGRAYSQAGSGMHHKICHVLGGRFNLPHAPLHTAVLPHVTAFNVPGAPDAAHRIARALGSDDPLTGIDRFYDEVGAERALSALGFAEADVEESAELCLPMIPASNPRPVTIGDLRALLEAARTGERVSGR